MTAKLAIRIGPAHWMDARYLDETLALLAEHPAITEVWLFTSATHAPLPLDELTRRADILGEVMPRFRAAGLAIGINHLSTIGHLDENADFSLDEPWQRLTGPDGATAVTGYCLSDPAMRGYVRDAYRLLAATAPDFLFIDDDIRLEGHKPLDYACFCERCLAEWATETSRAWSREELVEALDGATNPDALELRRRWLEHNRAYVRRALAHIRSAVDEIDGSLPLGFMTSPLGYGGKGYAAMAEALRGDRSGPVRWRPGGGFYDDREPSGVVPKIHAIASQTTALPPWVDDVTYELENFPYNVLDKSRRMMAAEIAASLAVGCTGVALNVFGVFPDAPEEFRPALREIARHAPFFDRVAAAFAGIRLEGLSIPSSDDLRATDTPRGSWFATAPWSNPTMPLGLSELGIPVAYGPAAATVLVGDTVLAYDAEELRDVFRGGVLLDGVALEHVERVGLGDLAGFTVTGTRTADTFEVYDADPLNGRFAGWSRDGRPSFDAEPARILEPRSEGARALAHLEDYGRRNHGTTSGVFENELGGRVAVFGYYPWTMLGSTAKVAQLHEVTDWVARGTLPMRVTSTTKGALWAGHAAGAVGLFLGTSLDAQTVELRLPAPARLQAETVDGPLEVQVVDDRTFRFDAAPFDAILLTTEG